MLMFATSGELFYMAVSSRSVCVCVCVFKHIKRFLFGWRSASGCGVNFSFCGFCGKKGSVSLLA